jgi:hypothetical protein
MGLEAATSLLASWRAKSPALLAFGGDSAIELASAVIVLWRFHTNAISEELERQTARIAGLLLFALAACVVATSAMALLGHSEAKPTPLGIGILTGSAALRADAAESALCGYLSLIALLGAHKRTVAHQGGLIPLPRWS